MNLAELERIEKDLCDGVYNVEDLLKVVYALRPILELMKQAEELSALTVKVPEETKSPD